MDKELTFNEARDKELSQTTSLTDVFNTLKEVIFKNLKVTTAAVVKDIVEPYSDETGFGVVNVMPIPIEEERSQYNVRCLYFEKYDFRPNQVVAVIFTDMNCEGNLRAGKQTQQKMTKRTSLHSQSNGIVIIQNQVTIEEIEDDNDHIKLTYNGKTYNVEID